MAECCNSITPPACTRRCAKLHDACCVVNTDNLPCLYPVEEVTATGTTGQYVITVDETIVLPDYGELLIEDPSGCIPDETYVTSVVGNQVTLSNKTTCTFTDRTLLVSTVQQRQCDINKAIDDRLCEIYPPACWEWNDMDLDVDWGVVPGYTAPRYSTVVGCTVRLSGSVQHQFIRREDCSVYSFNTMLDTPLPASVRPSATRILSATMAISEIDPASDNTVFAPVQIHVDTAGVITVYFYTDLVCIAPGTSNFKLYLPFDGLTYETN